MRRLVVLVAALGFGAGCTAEAGTEEGTGYVLLDRAARAADATISHDGWTGSPLLPLSLDASATLRFKSSEASFELPLRPGVLAHLHGPTGAVEWVALGEEASPDRLLVHASGEVAEALASRVGGVMIAREDGLFRVSAEDLYERVSFLEAPEDILEVLPDTSIDFGEVDADRSPAGGLVAALSARIDDLSELSERAAREASLVGIYDAGSRQLLLDASGAFSITDRCTGEVVGEGTFRAIGDRLVLQSNAAPLTLAVDGDALLSTSGAGFLRRVFDSGFRPDAIEEGEL